jgi:hypothetical protein
MGTLGEYELADNCENRPDSFTTVARFSVARYWSNFDKDCEPKLDPPAGSTAATWFLGQGSPLQLFTGSVYTLSLGVPARRLSSSTRATQVMIVIQTGGDDIRGGRNPGDNANVTLMFKGGATTTANVSRGRSWENGETHAAILTLPNPAPSVDDITGVTISTNSEAASAAIIGTFIRWRWWSASQPAARPTRRPGHHASVARRVRQSVGTIYRQRPRPLPPRAA